MLPSRCLKSLSGFCLLLAGCNGPQVGQTPSGRPNLATRGVALGVVNNGGGAPNGTPFVRLDFDAAPAESDGALSIVSVRAPPGGIRVDGLADAQEWRDVPSVSLSLSVATDLMSEDGPGNPNQLASIDQGVYLVDVWSAYDQENVYFRVEWQDATRSDLRGRWTYTSTTNGWQRRQGVAMSTVDSSLTDPLLASRPIDSSEDRFYLMLSDHPEEFERKNGCASMCHLAAGDGVMSSMVENRARLTSGGKMRTAVLGERVDAWHWSATRSAGIHLAVDGLFGCGEVTPEGACSGDGHLDDGDVPIEHVLPASAAACAGKKGDTAQSQNGSDPGTSPIVTNERFEAVDGGCVSRGPSRRPDTTAAFMYEPGARPEGAFGAEAMMIEDAAPPQVGDVAPGFIHRAYERGDCEGCSVTSRASWAQGRWTLEMTRTLKAPDEEDVSFLEP